MWILPALDSGPMDLHAPEIDEYAARHTTPMPGHLEQVAAATWEQMDAPHMLSGITVGRLLGTLAFVGGARRVLEIGTFTGYATMAMADAVGPDGHVWTCEADSATAQAARANVDASEWADRITILEGPALASIATLDGPLDLVFMDAAKHEYGDYLDAVLPRLSERGVIVADNTLWSGRVLDPGGPGADDADTVALAAFNERVATDPSLTAVMLTVRDGITLIRRSGS